MPRINVNLWRVVGQACFDFFPPVCDQSTLMAGRATSVAGESGARLITLQVTGTRN